MQNQQQKYHQQQQQGQIVQQKPAKKIETGNNPNQNHNNGSKPPMKPQQQGKPKTISNLSTKDNSAEPGKKLFKKVMPILQKADANQMDIEESMPMKNLVEQMKKISIMSSQTQSIGDIALKNQKKPVSVNAGQNQNIAQLQQPKANFQFSDNQENIIEEEAEYVQDKNEAFFEQHGSAIEKCWLAQMPNLRQDIKSSLDAGTRGKMVDWMIEVFSFYSCATTNDAFFKAVYIMDLYLKKQGNAFHDNDLHLMGVVCIFLGSKYEDMYAITIQDLCQNACHNNFTAIQVKEMEMKVLSTINFQLQFPTCFSLQKYFFYKIFQNDDQQMLKDLKCSAQYLLKMIMHAQNLFEQFPPSLIALSAIQYAVTKYREEQEQLQGFKNKLLMEIGNMQFAGKTFTIDQLEKCFEQIRNLSEGWKTQQGMNFKTLAKFPNFIARKDVEHIYNK